MLPISDTIEKEMILPAPPLEVWERSFGSAQALSSWFPERIEGELENGSSFFMIWGDHKCEARVVEFVPGQTLAYQWHPGDAHMLDSHPEEELTTVRFTLEVDPGGTKVKLVESGFANIPEARAAWALEQNTGGWNEEMAKLPKSYGL